MKKVTFYLASFLITSSLLVTPRAVEAQSVDATAELMLDRGIILFLPNLWPG